MIKERVIQLINKYQKLELDKVIDYNKFNHFAVVHHSTTIEGATLTEIETRLLLDENLTPKGKPLEHSLMTKDHYAALVFTLSSADTNRPISSSLIQEINGHVMKTTGAIYNTVVGTIDSTKGMFRKGNVSAGNTYFVNFDKVEKLVADLTTQLTYNLKKVATEIERLDVAFSAHYHLVTIHPFYDGNGRTSRLLMNFIQKLHNLPLAIVFKEDKAEYFEALENTRIANDIEIFQDFMYKQYEKHLTNEIRKYTDILPGGKSSNADYTIFL